MKKLISASIMTIILVLSLPLPLAAADGDVVIAAAASVTDAMKELMEAFRKEHPQAALVATYGSSGSLQKQIEQGAPVDIFLSAAAKQMNALEKGGMLLAGTRRDLLANSVVLVVPLKERKGVQIRGFGDLTGPGGIQLAMGEPASVPAGQYAEQVFKSLGILEGVKPRAVYGKDVRQVLAWVGTGEADAGVVYATDAALSPDVRVVATAPSGSHDPVIYPVAIMKDSAHAPEARVFVDWMASNPVAAGIFARYGFGKP